MPVQQTLKTREPALAVHILAATEIEDEDLARHIGEFVKGGGARNDARYLAELLDALRRDDGTRYAEVLSKLRHAQMYSELLAQHSRVDVVLVASDQPATVSPNHRRGDTVLLAPHVSRGLQSRERLRVQTAVACCSLVDESETARQLQEPIHSAIVALLERGGGWCYFVDGSGAIQMRDAVREVLESVVPLGIPLLSISKPTDDGSIDPRRIDRGLRSLDSRGAAALVLRSLQIGSVEVAQKIIHSLEGDEFEIARKVLCGELERAAAIELLRLNL